MSDYTIDVNDSPRLAQELEKARKRQALMIRRKIHLGKEFPLSPNSRFIRSYKRFTKGLKLRSYSREEG